MDPWFFVLFGVVFVGVWYFGRLKHKKKIAEFTAYAAQRGWRYTERDHSLVDRFRGQPFGTGNNRRAQHVLRGRHRERDALAFEYSYRVPKGDNKSETYQFTVVALATPTARPTLEVTREGLGRKLLGFVGIRDLQLESEEFNKTFHIRTDDEKFAYDILNPKMMEWMLSGPALDLPFRFEGGHLLVWQPDRIETSTVDNLLGFAGEVLDRTPSFVWK
jgi:hypothetical protein